MSHSVAIRADASLELGSGHVRRCLTLAHRLRERGATVSFVSKSGPGDCFEEIRHAGFDLRPLTGMGIPEAISALDELKASAVIVDHYGLNEEWERAAEQSGVRVAAIDDLADRRHHCAVLIDQNITAVEPGRYEGLVPPECRLLLGPAYAMLREQFDKVRRFERTGTIRHIVVSFGAFDAADATTLSLRALQQSRLRDAFVDVLLDPQAPHAANVRDFCERTPNMRFAGAVENMAKLLERADFAIGACGTSQWERAYAGVPALLVSIAQNQVPGSQSCARHGIAAYAGAVEELTVEMLARLLDGLARDPETLRRYSHRSLEMMGTGGGSQAVAQAVLDLC